MPYKHIGGPVSHAVRGMLKKPIRRKDEGPMEFYKRYQRWMKITRMKPKPKPSKPKPKPKSKKPKPKQKLTEREQRIKDRKEAEELLGIKRGVKKKPPKKPPKKRPIKKKKKK